MEDIEQIFRDDVRSKSQHTGVRAYRSRGGVVMPSDLTKGYSKRRMKKMDQPAQHVMDLTYQEFLKLGKEERKVKISTYREHYSAIEIAKMWGVAASSVYNADRKSARNAEPKKKIAIKKENPVKTFEIATNDIVKKLIDMKKEYEAMKLENERLRGIEKAYNEIVEAYQSLDI